MFILKQQQVVLQMEQPPDRKKIPAIHQFLTYFHMEKAKNI